MKVLLVHNFYQHAGGEDQVFRDEGWLLESHGHQVVRYTRHNEDVQQTGRLKLFAKTIWNQQSHHELRELIRRERPTVMHCHNTFPLISPSAYYAARAENVAVVQELHNFRLLCPNALFLRDGKVCEDCLGKLVPWPAIKHGCYRGSKAVSAVASTMLGVHRLANTWTDAVDRYITLSEFSKSKFIEGGLPADRIEVKPHFVQTDPMVGSGKGNYVIFVGRLSPEKGIETLLAAWKHLGGAVPLKVLGDGAMAEQAKKAAEEDKSIEVVGHRPVEEVMRLVGEARLLVFPSVWYEGLPKTMVESFAKGTPIVASRLGAMAEVIEEGKSGLLFEAGNAAELAAKIRSVFSNEKVLSVLRQGARETYEKRYTAEENYRMLMGVYERALASRRSEPVGLVTPVSA